MHGVPYDYHSICISCWFCKSHSFFFFSLRISYWESVKEMKDVGASIHIAYMNICVCVCVYGWGTLHTALFAVNWCMLQCSMYALSTVGSKRVYDVDVDVVPCRFRYVLSTHWRWRRELVWVSHTQRVRQTENAYTHTHSREEMGIKIHRKKERGRNRGNIEDADVNVDCHV